MLIKAYIGIGSNLENPLHQITLAKKALKQLSHNNEFICSPLYQSSPRGDIEQPDYLNAVACINILQSESKNPETAALELLDQLQAIENTQGRKRLQHWGARTVDLDLLVYDNKTIAHPRLTVPHHAFNQDKGLGYRNFVIYPLADIAFDLALPDGTLISELYNKCSSEGIRRIE
ncbi:MAG: 2-amino-4-hydroxy-6-hydroxymethyldihydropteridine diphosphokinase [Enterobacterales bacterium]|jgi:2-amino-4-hydroxy-6-hydroxymethyldihydropteridine diphosphokinase